MTQKLLYSKISLPKTKDAQLFSGIWLRWKALTKAEQLICANIVFFPLWWTAGIISHMLLILLLIGLFQEWQQYGKIKFKQPSLFVIALFAYYLYGYLDTWLVYFDLYPSIDLPTDWARNPNNLVKATLQFALPCLVWYLQSHNIKVRKEPLIWACSVSVIMMLLLWLVVEFVNPTAFNPPPRTLYAILTKKNPVYEYGSAMGDGAGNYLLIKEEGRYRFFFDHYQTCAVFLGFVGLLALDLKNRLWSILLFIACCFLMGVTGARAVWIAFTPAVFVHLLSNSFKTKGIWFLFAAFALCSFLLLSVPSITNLAVDTIRGTEQSIAKARPGSTEARSKVYQETLNKIPEKPLFGYKVEGEAARQGPNLYTDGGPAIGSHSFILGTLLYQKGILGATLFGTFWISLFFWMYETRRGRPLSCFLVLIMLTITSSVSIIHLTMTTSVLLCMIIRQPSGNFSSLKGKPHYA
ncbi:O-antigen ligase [Chroococcus sp. FPU101]|uniref:O-antigen ligase family protein n=1 Tax=Chroococcus sp. FPU101 TaxID=1974212 RepID=UPI001A8DB507|nr:O-antigen ligase family protein [Chroococcus sp. FPU101]GFE69616.1 O-antigen polymerase [Chroococcus sp. FPU101]